MIQRLVISAERIHQELADLEQVIARVERGMAAAQQRPEDLDLYLDAVALNIHDFYTGLERIFRHIAATVDGSVPESGEWHRELLRQMSIELPQIRPRVLSAEVVQILDEYLGFRHVVRNIYAFQFDPERIEHLVIRLRPGFERVRAELLSFAAFLVHLAAADAE